MDEKIITNDFRGWQIGQIIAPQMHIVNNTLQAYQVSASDNFAHQNVVCETYINEFTYINIYETLCVP